MIEPAPPKMKYRMFWRGEWRPVMRMYDAQNKPTTLALRAAKAILYLTPTTGAIVAAGPADILENADYRTSDWDTVY